MLNKVTCHVTKHALLENRNYKLRSFYNLCSLIPDALNNNYNPQHEKHHQVGYIQVYELVLFYSRFLFTLEIEFYTHTKQKSKIIILWILNRIEPGYTDIGLCDTSSIASNILWHQLIPYCYP